MILLLQLMASIILNEGSVASPLVTTRATPRNAKQKTGKQN